MTRSDLSSDLLLKLAKQSLRISASESSVRLLFPSLLQRASYSLQVQYDMIPEGYVDELRKHVKFSKDDTLFHIIPEPGYGCKSTRLLTTQVHSLPRML